MSGRGSLAPEVCCGGPGRSTPAIFTAGAAAWLAALAAAGAGLLWAAGPCNLGLFASISCAHENIYQPRKCYGASPVYAI